MVFRTQFAGLLHDACDLLFLQRRGGNHEIATFSPPDVAAAFGGEGADTILCPVASLGDGKSAVPPESLNGGAQGGPVAVNFSAILATRTGAADRSLDQNNGKVRATVLESERGPKSSESAADNGDVGCHFSFERRGDRHVAFVPQGFIEPPGAIGRIDGGRGESHDDNAVKCCA